MTRDEWVVLGSVGFGFALLLASVIFQLPIFRDWLWFLSLFTCSFGAAASRARIASFAIAALAIALGVHAAITGHWVLVLGTAYLAFDQTSCGIVRRGARK